MKIRRIATWLAPLVTIAALVWIGKDFNWRSAFTMVGMLESWQLLIILIFPASYYSVSAWRFGTILRYLDAEVTFLTLFELTIGSFAASYALPSGDLAGKSVKLAILSAKERIGPEKTVPALSVEALVGSGTDLVLRAVLLFFLSLNAFLHEAIFKIALTASLAPALFFLPLMSPALARKMIRKQKAFDIYMRMRAEFLQLFSMPFQLAALAGISAISFTLGLAEIKIAAMLIGIPLDAKAALLVYTAFHAAWIIPAPGGIGAIEGVLAGIFWALGGNPLWGLAIAITFRLKEFAWVLIGFLALAKNGISISKSNNTS